MKGTILAGLLIGLSATTHAEKLTQPAPKNTLPTKPNIEITETAIAPTSPQVIDCNYHITGKKNQIDPNLISKWAEKAATQSFSFDYKTLDKQLGDLKHCYTDQGWQGFNEALQKSGNLASIKSQKLMVNSTIKGTTSINDIQDNQWKVSLPIQVTYQNGKEKITQSLIIDLVIGRKVSGDLGIMQLVAKTDLSEQTKPADKTPLPSATTVPAHKH